MKVKDGIVIREVAGSIVAVPTGDVIKETKSIIYLTESGKFIMETLQKEDLNSDAVAQKLVDRYGIDMNTAKTDSERFMDKLKEAKLVVEEA